MNEISRCCRLLGVKHGASFEEVKKVYRDLVQVWHPDRFSGNERLAAKAQEQLKEINLAYEYLVAHGFQDGVLIEPEDEVVTTGEGASASTSEPGTFDGEAGTEEPAKPRSSLWLFAIVVIILVGCSVLLFLHLHGGGQSGVPVSDGSNNHASALPKPNAQTNPTPTPTLANSSSSPAPAASSFAFTKDILATLSATNGPDALTSPYLLSPPFAIRARTMFTNLNLPDLRLCYGLGQVIFNWGDHPEELRVHDPRNWNATGVAKQGLLLPNTPHELLWTITTDNMSVTVDGQVRFQAKGDYSTAKGYPGFYPASGRDLLKSFVLETPAPLEVVEPTREHGPVPNDILSSLVPEKPGQTTNRADGVTLWSAGGSDNRLMSAQNFQAPFVIRTRAKTDALNLRLYCGKGELIFNWERNLNELRVHDPLSGAQSGLANRGLITANEWHAIIWEIQNTGMNVYVDGKLRFQNQKDYRKLNGRVGIGPALSRITVNYFQVEKK